MKISFGGSRRSIYSTSSWDLFTTKVRFGSSWSFHCSKRHGNLEWKLLYTFLFWVNVLFCSPSWPGTHNAPVIASQVLGIQACAAVVRCSFHHSILSDSQHCLWAQRPHKYPDVRAILFQDWRHISSCLGPEKRADRVHSSSYLSLSLLCSPFPSTKRVSLWELSL